MRVRSIAGVGTGTDREPAAVDRGAGPAGRPDRAAARRARSRPRRPQPSRPPAAPVPADRRCRVAEPVLPPPVWQPARRAQLAAYIRAVGREGLDPADYDPAGLDRAMRSGDPRRLVGGRDRALQQAVVGPRARPCPRRRAGRLACRRQGSRRRRASARCSTRRSPPGSVAEALNSLLPTHPQYGALRYALEVTPKAETAKLNRIRLNMDRWRWLPRDLGQKYIIVNVPAFHATLVENGVTRWKHKAIAGAIKTPTPQLSVMATGVILNPSWEVPKSISRGGRQARLRRDQGQGRQVRALEPAAGAEQCARPAEVRDVQSAQHLSARHQCPKPLQQPGARAQPRLHPDREVLDLATELLGDDGGEWTPEKIARDAGQPRRRSRPIS